MRKTICHGSAVNQGPVLPSKSLYLMLSWRANLTDEKGPDLEAGEANLWVMRLVLSAVENLKCTTSQQKEVGTTALVEIIMGLSGDIYLHLKCNTQWALRKGQCEGFFCCPQSRIMPWYTNEVCIAWGLINNLGLCLSPHLFSLYISGFSCTLCNLCDLKRSLEVPRFLTIHCLCLNFADEEVNWLTLNHAARLVTNSRLLVPLLSSSSAPWDDRMASEDGHIETEATKEGSTVGLFESGVSSLRDWGNHKLAHLSHSVMGSDC